MDEAPFAASRRRWHVPMHGGAHVYGRHVRSGVWAARVADDYCSMPSGLIELVYVPNLYCDGVVIVRDDGPIVGFLGYTERPNTTPEGG